MDYYLSPLSITIDYSQTSTSLSTIPSTPDIDNLIYHISHHDNTTINTIGLFIIPHRFHHRFTTRMSRLGISRVLDFRWRHWSLSEDVAAEMSLVLWWESIAEP